jgi:hypothetical protein
MIVVNALIVIMATGLNLLIVLTFVKTTSLRETPSNLLVLCLAISDFGVGVIAQPIFITQLFAQLTRNVSLYMKARVVWSFFGLFLAAASFLTLTAITADRYLAFRLHLRYKELVTTRRYGIVIIFIWIASLVTGLYRLKFEVQTTRVLFFVIYIALLIINAFFLIKISQVIHRHSVQIQAQQQSTQQSIDMPRYKKSVNTMYFVIGAFCLCYIPYLIFRMRQVIWNNSIMINWLITHTIIVTLSTLNSVLNPVIYCIRVGEIRTAVCTLLRRFTQLNQ